MGEMKRKLMSFLLFVMVVMSIHAQNPQLSIELQTTCVKGKSIVGSDGVNYFCHDNEAISPIWRVEATVKADTPVDLKGVNAIFSVGCADERNAILSIGSDSTEWKTSFVVTGYCVDDEKGYCMIEGYDNDIVKSDTVYFKSLQKDNPDSAKIEKTLKSGSSYVLAINDSWTGGTLFRLNPNRSLGPVRLTNIKVLGCPPKP